MNERSSSRLLGTSSDGFLCELWWNLGFHKKDSYFFFFSSWTALQLQLSKSQLSCDLHTRRSYPVHVSVALLTKKRYN